MGNANPASAFVKGYKRSRGNISAWRGPVAHVNQNAKGIDPVTGICPAELRERTCYNSLQDVAVVSPRIGGGLGYGPCVASFAGLWRGLVKEDEVSAHRLFKRVAGRAGNILVAAFEGKCRLIVIEQRRPPLVAVMASGAVAGLGAELVCMRVLVAVPASRGSTLELNMKQGQLHVGRLVAICAGHGAM